MVIIYKKRKNIHFRLQFNWFWCIVFERYIAHYGLHKILCARIYSCRISDICMKEDLMYRQKCVLVNKLSQIRLSNLFFLSAWFFGSLTSLYIISFVPDSTLFLFRSILHNRTTLFGLILVQMLPLLMSCFTFWLRKPEFAYPVIFFKAFSFSYCLFGIFLLYDTAGWMMRWVILFSASCSILPLIWFWYRNFPRRGVSFNKDVCICTFIVILFCLVDY